jgi:hypothetical protein
MRLDKRNAWVPICEAQGKCRVRLGVAWVIAEPEAQVPDREVAAATRQELQPEADVGLPG